MGAPYCNVHEALEDLFSVYIQSTVSPDKDVQVYAGEEVSAYDDEVKEPFMAAFCNDSTPLLPEIDLAHAPCDREVVVIVKIRSHIEDITDPKDITKVIKAAREVHRDLVGQVLDAFYCADIVARLNATGVPGVQVNQIDQHTQRKTVVGRSIVTELTFPVKAVAVNT